MMFVQEEKVRRHVITAIVKPSQVNFNVMSDISSIVFAEKSKKALIVKSTKIYPLTFCR